ncbi:MAG: AAA family ATPase, partial [Desulfobacterales bacterium]|nr:AAA family ATPase [Desulfobacterales bacterium]
KRFEELQQELKTKCAFEKEIKPRSRLMLYLEFIEVRKAIEEMIAFNTYQAYLQLFLDMKLFEKLADGTKLPENLDTICNFTSEQLTNNQLCYEDLAPYLYFKGELEGTSNMSEIKHVVIDEAQDYSPIQYEIFHQLFNKNSFTILGDLNQTINPLMETNTLEKIAKAFSLSNSTILKLNKSYRSTKEIVDFTKQILPSGEKIQSIHRLGEKPLIIEVKEKNKLCKLVIEDVRTFLQQGFRSIAIICKTARESLEVYNQLKDQIEITLVTKDDEYFKYGVVVIPADLARGREFDVVSIYEASSVNYHRENERNLFYTICTRALHKLYIYYTNSLSPFIADIPETLYEIYKSNK